RCGRGGGAARATPGTHGVARGFGGTRHASRSHVRFRCRIAVLPLRRRGLSTGGCAVCRARHTLSAAALARRLCAPPAPEPLPLGSVAGPPGRTAGTERSGWPRLCADSDHPPATAPY